MELAIQTPWDPERLDEAARLGLRAIQLRVGPGFPIALDDDSLADARRAATDLRDRGLRVVALGYYRNLLAPDPAEREREIAGLRQVLRMAPLFGTDLIGVFAGRDPEKTVDDNLPAFVRVWGPLAEEASGLGLRLAFENCTMFKGYPVRGINLCHTPYAYARMFDLLPSESLGIELDPSHLHKQRIDSLAFVRQFADRIFHVHAKDHERLEDLVQLHGSFAPETSRDRLPGQGEIDFPSFFRVLAECGYRGDVTLEVERGSLVEIGATRESALRQCIEFLRRASAADRD